MGHMTEIDYAAFDPVFWLHHWYVSIPVYFLHLHLLVLTSLTRSNVDRLFAIWQALNPQSYTINKQTPDGTFVITANSIETAMTPLAPFNDASGTKYWTSEGVRSTETFNYAYPETQRWKFSSNDDYANSVMSAVQQLYGGVSNQFGGNQGFNLMATPSTLPAARAVQQKQATHPVVNGSATGSAQKPMAEPAAHAPAAHDSKSHPFREFMGKLTGKSKQSTDGTRDLDLEAEIGKRRSPFHLNTLGEQYLFLISRSFYCPLSSAKSGFLHRIHLQPPCPETYPKSNLPRARLPRSLRSRTQDLAHARCTRWNLRRARQRPRNNRLRQMQERLQFKPHDYRHRSSYSRASQRMEQWQFGWNGKGERPAVFEG